MKKIIFESKSIGVKSNFLKKYDTYNPTGDTDNTAKKWIGLGDNDNTEKKMNWL